MMAHPCPAVVKSDLSVMRDTEGSTCSSFSMGRSGVNALDAAMMAYNNISVLRQQMKPTWRVHA